ncbi:MAG: peptide chain release factor N(5)-glutamine methyltransferase [Burkholderiaceae bacterium]|nr:peptide chain release factor N(5)-glutamine methyltransferase [Burkholderiaceae bacterium]
MARPDILAGASLGELQRLKLLDPLETRVLLSFALGLSRVQLITQSDHVITEDEALCLRQLFARRLAGEPIAYITGEREFYGLTFKVTPDVLIPRPETELLVELALERLPQRGRVLDLGTGSGAIALAIAHARPDAWVTAVDASAAALAVARINAARLLAGNAARVDFWQSDWYAALPVGAKFDLIVANPPYIHHDDAHLQQGDLRFEPADALTDHQDGLSALRNIVADAPARLTPAGWLLMEHGFDQAAAVCGLLAAQSFSRVQSWRDLAGLERVSGGML